jgi:hypothetical protein
VRRFEADQGSGCSKMGRSDTEKEEEKIIDLMAGKDLKCYSDENSKILAVYTKDFILCRFYRISVSYV